jgi:hypothetical protein
VKLMQTLRNGIAGTLIAVVPVTAGLAVTRPSAAVPMAGSAAVAAQYDDDAGTPWLALGAIGLALVVAAWILLDGDDDGEGAISRA